MTQSGEKSLALWMNITQEGVSSHSTDVRQSGTVLWGSRTQKCQFVNMAEDSSVRLSAQEPLEKCKQVI